MYIRGVNLGNWLVLEKWMNRAMFAGCEAEDEYYLPRMLPREVYEERIRMHRAEYITERDFARIKAIGLNAVRIPVPYFIFGDYEPFIGCIEELDKAMGWAKKYGLKVLIDLHTAPDSQNGFDNGGISGICCFCKEPNEVEFVLTVLERLAERYKDHEALYGIEILNEPVLDRNFKKMGIQDRYIPLDKEKAAISEGNPESFVRQFYLDAYDRIRKYLPEDKAVVFHDAFELTLWKDFMRDPKYKNVVLDTHQYFGFHRLEEGTDPMAAYHEISDELIKQIDEMEQYFPVVVGEWCLSNAAVMGVEDPEEAKKIYNDFQDIEFKTWGHASGYFYWSYKLLLDTVTPGPDGKATPAGAASWDMGKSVDEGWLTRV